MSVPAGADVHKPADWFRIDQIVLSNYPGIGAPKNIDKMTLSEITLCISDPHAPRPFAGAGTDMSADEIAAGLAHWRSMTPRQKLEWIRDNNG